MKYLLYRITYRMIYLIYESPNILLYYFLYESIVRGP